MRKGSRKPKTKKECQIAHAKRRFLERFGVALTTAELQQFVYHIQNGTAKFVSRSSKRLTLWDVPFRGEMIQVVYDSERKTIVTGYKPDKPVHGEKWSLEKDWQLTVKEALDGNCD